MVTKLYENEYPFIRFKAGTKAAELYGDWDDLILVDGTITTVWLLEDWEHSLAHLCHDGKIRQDKTVIGTSKDIEEAQEDIAADKAELPYIAMKADISAIDGKLRSMETSIVKWVVATALAFAALAFAAGELIQ